MKMGKEPAQVILSWLGTILQQRINDSSTGEFCYS